jgi:hypothetical protein
MLRLRLSHRQHNQAPHLLYRRLNFNHLQDDQTHLLPYKACRCTLALVSNTEYLPSPSPFHRRDGPSQHPQCAQRHRLALGTVSKTELMPRPTPSHHSDGPSQHPRSAQHHRRVLDTVSKMASLLRLSLRLLKLSQTHRPLSTRRPRWAGATHKSISRMLRHNPLKHSPAAHLLCYHQIHTSASCNRTSQTCSRRRCRRTCAACLRTLTETTSRTEI